MKERHIHNWQVVPYWGVLVGVANCTRCRKLSERKDFEKEVSEE